MKNEAFFTIIVQFGTKRAEKREFLRIFKNTGTFFQWFFPFLTQRSFNASYGSDSKCATFPWSRNRGKNPFDKPGAADFFLRLFKFFLAPAAPKLFPATYGCLKLFLASAAPKNFPAAYGRLRFFLAPAAPEIFPAGGTPQNGPIFFPAGRHVLFLDIWDE